MTTIKTIAAGALALAVVGAPLAASARSNPYRPLTVAPRYAPAQGGYVPARPVYNPYQGPGVLVTAPIHFAGTVATAPFQAVNTVFPARGDTPLTVVGAPVYAAGQLVALPFRILEAPFGGPNPFSD